jgi:hypothetical protein
MSRWIDRAEAAEELGVALPTLRKLLNSTNPPPYVRPSERASDLVRPRGIGAVAADLEARGRARIRKNPSCGRRVFPESSSMTVWYSSISTI